MKATTLACLASLATPLMSALPAQEPEPAVSQVRIDDANTFAFDIFRQLDTEGNALLSPYSISAAFAMCWAACDGKTHEEIGKALRFTQDPAVLHRVMAELQRSLQANPDAGYELAVANRLWGSSKAADGYYQQPFLDLVKRTYGGGFELVDFAAAQEARATINRWVAKQTNERIPDLIPPGALNGLVMMVITNAVYFQGTWKHQFDPKLTRPGAFHVTADREVTVPMMHRMGQLAFAQTKDALITALPYTGDRIRMVVALPAPGVDLAALEARMSPAVLAGWTEALKQQPVDLSLPRFRLAAKYKLHEKALPALGMKRPFEFTTDWTPLNAGVEELRISHVFHDTFVAVDEKGTEAAGATAIVVKKRGRVQRLRLDRPFLFAIQDRETGLVLFLGRVADPSSSEQ